MPPPTPSEITSFLASLLLEFLLPPVGGGGGGYFLELHIADPSSMQDACLTWPACHESFVAQWLEHSTGVGKVIGSIPFGDSDFFFVLWPWHVDHIISHFFTELKIYHHYSVISSELFLTSCDGI